MNIIVGDAFFEGNFLKEVPLKLPSRTLKQNSYSYSHRKYIALLFFSEVKTRRTLRTDEFYGYLNVLRYNEFFSPIRSVKQRFLCVKVITKTASTFQNISPFAFLHLCSSAGCK